MRKLTVHYADRGMRQEGWLVSACDAERSSIFSAKVTIIKSRVTCGNCKRTKVYKESK